MEREKAELTAQLEELRKQIDQYTHKVNLCKENAVKVT